MWGPLVRHWFFNVKHFSEFKRLSWRSIRRGLEILMVTTIWWHIAHVARSFQIVLWCLCYCFPMVRGMRDNSSVWGTNSEALNSRIGIKHVVTLRLLKTRAKRMVHSIIIIIITVIILLFRVSRVLRKCSRLKLLSITLQRKHSSVWLGHTSHMWINGRFSTCYNLDITRYNLHIITQWSVTHLNWIFVYCNW